jgi:hypothetical protein
MPALLAMLAIGAIYLLVSEPLSPGPPGLVLALIGILLIPLLVTRGRGQMQLARAFAILILRDPRADYECRLSADPAPDWTYAGASVATGCCADLGRERPLFPRPPYYQFFEALIPMRKRFDKLALHV